MEKREIKNVFVYPVMDGAYITASNQEDMEKLLTRIFDSLASVFLSETDNNIRFAIQAGLSYGESIHGHLVPYSASRIFELDLSYKNNILLGTAMIEAYEAGSSASPFGIALAESAKKGSGVNSRHGSFDPNWKWYTSERIKINTDYSFLSDELIAFFESFRPETHPLHYDPARIDCHVERVKDYFE